MEIYPKVIILDNSDTDTASDTEEEDKPEPENRTSHRYISDEERHMASVRRAVMGIPEPESDPESDPEAYGPEMDSHYDVMVRTWLTVAAIVTILSAISPRLTTTTNQQ